MATQRALSIEDRNLESSTLVTARDRVYRDMDLSFEARPSGDLYIKKDAAAVKQAIKTLILTNRFERPFQPNLGADLSQLLFELNNTDIAQDIKEQIKAAIQTYEPRAEVLGIQTTPLVDTNEVQVTIVFNLVNTEEQVTLTVNVSRLR